MDVLSLTPEDIQSPDTTFEVEGYEDHVEEIEQAYPDKDWRPADEQAEQMAQEQQQAEQAAGTAAFTGEQPPLVPEAQKYQELVNGPSAFRAPPPTEPKEGEAAYKEGHEPDLYETPDHLTKRAYGDDGFATEESILDAEGRQIYQLPNGKEVIQALKLRSDWNEKENEVYRLLNGTNLKNKLEAFNMIRNDPELLAIYDHNNDGELTYDDFFDTTNLNGGNGMSDEEDRIATEEWLGGLASGDLGSRLRAIHQKYGAGQDMALYINRARQGYFNPSWQQDWKASGGGAWFDIGAERLEGIGSIGDVLQGKSWHENSTFDDNLLQHKNPQSHEFLVNNPLVTTKDSKDIYNGTYWATTALVTALEYKFTGGALTALGNASKMDKLVKVGGVVKGLAGGPGWAGVARGTVMDTIVPGLFRDYQKDGIGMMRQRGVLRWAVDNYGGPAELFVPAVANGFNTPEFKRFDNIMSEAVGTGAVFGTFKVLGWGGKFIWRNGKQVVRQGIPDAARWGVENAKTLGNNVKDWNFRLGAELLSDEGFYKQTQQRMSDITEAGKEQLRKGAQGFRNAYVGTDTSPGFLHSTYGVYKNGQKLVGQGTTRIRSGIRQVINDLDQIRHTIGTSHKGSTDALFNQNQMAKSAKGGITEPWFDNAAEELLTDKTWKQQVNSQDVLKNTRRIRSETAQIGIQEVMGRDAARLSPDQYWGKAILDLPLNVKDFKILSDFEKWAVKNVEVQDAVNKQLLLQLRDTAIAAGEMVGKTDLYAVDGPMRRIADNLVVGLSQVKKTQFTHKLAAEMMQAGDGKLTQAQLADLTGQVAKRSRQLHSETRQGVSHMLNMLMEQGDDDMAEALLDVFKVSNDIHNWKDFDAWMHQKIVGGEFKGKVKTGALIHELQQVMVQSMLSGPKTPLRAIIGTTTNAYLNTINEAFGAIIRQPFTGDVVARKASVAKLKGMFELIPEAWDVFKNQWDAKFNANIADIRTRYYEGPTRGDQLFEAERIWTEARGTDGEKAALYMLNTARNTANNKLFGWSPRAMAATDETYKWLMARARSKELAMRQVLQETGENWAKITPDMLSKAEDLHYERLLDGNGNIDIRKDSWFQKQFEEVTLTSPLKGTAAKLDQVFNDIPLIKPFYLFARTGVNGLNLSFKSTPILGALHKESLAILRHTGDDFTELARFGINNANDLGNARNLFAGRQAIGATVVTGMSGMYMANQLTGNGPADRQLRQQWINAGWKPNHLYIGDFGFDYSSLEPFNVIFSSIADIGDNMELMGSEWAEKRLQAVAFVIGRGLTGKTYMSGLDQLMQIMQMKPGALNKATANILNNSLPLAGMRNEFGKWINPHMKELNSSMWDSIRNRNQAFELLALKPLPEKSDILNGKPINNWNIIGRSFNAISPIQMDIRNDTPGRRLLLESNYDLKSTTYAYGGYSFVKNNHVRAHFQNEIGKVPITVGFKKFKNVEDALTYLSNRPDVIKSMEKMRANQNNPANYDIDPNTYPHNTLIDNIFNQARAKAWAKLNQTDHPAYADVQELKGEKDGKTTRTRDNRNEIIDLSFPQKPVQRFPKN